VYQANWVKIQESGIRNKLGLADKGYLLASIHREENVEDGRRLFEIIRSLGDLGREYRVPIIFSTHPRTRERLSQPGVRYIPNNNVVLHNPFGMIDYVNLQLGALCCLSDSGTISEDSAILGIPAVNIREATERPEVHDTGNIILSGVEHQSIMDSVRLVITQKIVRECPLEYKSTEFSTKAIRLIMGYHQHG
jgi:UDP-N-acetylglucosamine 2-epimerase (non-hydrolysing)